MRADDTVPGGVDDTVHGGVDRGADGFADRGDTGPDRVGTVPGEPAPPVEYRRLDPRVRLLWWLAGALTVVPLLLVAGVLAVIVDDPAGAVPLIVVAVIGIPLAVVVPWLRYRRWRYALRDEDLWIRRGMIWVNVSVIPYLRLQFVDTTRGPLDRLFGLAQLVVHTAAPGTSGRLPGLAVEQAEQLREKLAHVRADVRV